MNIEQVLREQLMALRAGSTDVKRANALCNTAGKYIGFIRLKLDLLKMAGAKPNGRFLEQINASLPKHKK